MKIQIIIIGAVGLIVGILVAPVFNPFMSTMWGGKMMGNMDQVDAHFIEQMIPHHEDAITMANLALAKAEHSEIKSLANDIIRSQSAEINQMEQWYKSWFGKDVSNISGSMGHGINTMMHGGMMGDASDLESLETAKSFDRAFIEEMIPHHQMAVMMAQMLQATTSRPEMERLAKNIINTQTREINSMRSWYRQWYGQ